MTKHKRVPDGFHIVSWMADALGKISRRLWNQARGNGDDEAARRMRGVRYAVLKNPDRLAGRQDESPTALRNTDPRGRLYRARQLKELLRGLLGHPIGQAEDELKHWVFRASRSRIPEIVESARKIRRRRPDILRTIGSGYPNARLEAFNNRIKVTIRMAYGFQRVTNLISLIMLRCGGLDIRLPEPVS
ncbi:transposase [Bifidobacterium breve]|uniref:transposase n=1 Tax=Bifidobacterium breve TaxID=1685 RepID=UPI000CA13F33|nr:transposase [Bifidobacterium breve]